MSSCLQLRVGLNRSNGAGLRPVSQCLQPVSNVELVTRLLLSPTVSSPFRGGDKETAQPGDGR